MDSVAFGKLYFKNYFKINYLNVKILDRSHRIPYNAFISRGNYV